jgi:cell division protein FtsB
MDLTGRLNQILGPLIALLLMIYFGYHIVQGERGFFSWMRLRQKITESQEHLSQLHSEKEVLERRVGLLRPDSLDQDMLEQRAREVLNLGNPDEVVIYDDVPAPSTPTP